MPKCSTNLHQMQHRIAQNVTQSAALNYNFDKFSTSHPEQPNTNKKSELMLMRRATASV